MVRVANLKEIENELKEKCEMRCNVILAPYTNKYGKKGLVVLLYHKNSGIVRVEVDCTCGCFDYYCQTSNGKYLNTKPIMGFSSNFFEIIDNKLILSDLAKHYINVYARHGKNYVHLDDSRIIM